NLSQDRISRLALSTESLSRSAAKSFHHRPGVVDTCKSSRCFSSDADRRGYPSTTNCQQKMCQYRPMSISILCNKFERMVNGTHRPLPCGYRTEGVRPRQMTKSADTTRRVPSFQARTTDLGEGRATDLNQLPMQQSLSRGEIIAPDGRRCDRRGRNVLVVEL